MSYYPKQAFRDVFALVSDPAKWCQGANCLTANSAPIRSPADVPAKWDALAALHRFCGSSWVTYFARKVMGVPPNQKADAESELREFNDTLTHAEVVELFRATGEREGWL